MVGVEVGGGTAADKERPHRAGFAQRLQLPCQCLQVMVNQVVLPGDDRKGEVAAVVGTKRHVDVGGMRVKPRRMLHTEPLYVPKAAGIAGGITPAAAAIGWPRLLRV